MERPDIEREEEIMSTSDESGAQAVEELAPRAMAIPKEQLASMRGLDLELAATRMLEIGRWVATSEIRARFERLPLEEFNIANLDLIEAAAKATLHLVDKLEMASMTEAEVARLPVELLENALTMRRRMIKLARYHFDEHPQHSMMVNHFGEISHVFDLVRDLERLANLYEEEVVAVEQDTRHFRPTDHSRALSLADQLRGALFGGHSDEARELDTELAGVWTVLVEAYDETRSAALFLFRHDPDLLTTFSSVRELGRRPSTRDSELQVSLDSAPEDAALPAGVATTPDGASASSPIARFR